jgi:hypothetical protein
LRFWRAPQCGALLLLRGARNARESRNLKGAAKTPAPFKFKSNTQVQGGSFTRTLTNQNGKSSPNGEQLYAE